MIFSRLEILILLLVIALLTTSLFRYIKFPAIVGYIFVGILVGPYTLNLISDSHDVRYIAEFGIVFLMFTIGLEFSLSKMIAIKKIVFGYGGIQVVLSTLLTALVGMNLDMTLAEILIVAGIVALSSTAIVLKQLTDQSELYLKHGINSLGILLFQDLAVIPLLILIPRLENIEIFGLTEEISWAFVKGVLAFMILVSIGRWVLRPLFYFIAKAKSLELFTLLTLFITLSAAWLTEELGLSMALGAFLAGMMLSETEFRHQIETDIRPFKDVLLSFFFISVGMQLDISIVFDAWPWVLLLLLALAVFKSLLISTICFIFDRDKTSALRTGLTLAQGSEFGFVILTSAMSYNLLRQEYAQVILCALLISMALAPIIISHNRKLALAVIGKRQDEPQSDMETLKEYSKELANHVIICGYGRVGRMVANFLSKADIPYCVLDLDANRVKEASQKGERISFANATHPEVLMHANIQRSGAVVVCFYDTVATSKMIQYIRHNYGNLPVIIRTHDDVEADYFYQLGATEVIPETFETSVMLASHLLLLLKVHTDQVSEWINESRNDRYDLLRMAFPNKMTIHSDDIQPPNQGLHTVTITTNAYAINRKISDFPLLTSEINVTTIRRNKTRIINPPDDTVLEKNDVIVLYGSFSLLEAAEKMLLFGEE